MTEPTIAAATRPPIPYLPFDTFRNFVDGLSGGRPLPPRIDRSLMAGMAGGTQTLLLGTLTTFGLISESREVLPPFVQLVRAEAEQRQQLMTELLRHTYPEPMDLARQHATADQLAEAFRELSGYQGSTLRKAITFFLNMAKYAQVELSPFFRAPAQSNPAQKQPTRRGRTRPNSEGPVSVPSPATPGPGAVESRTLGLGSGGTVTISCSVAFLTLNKADRDFVLDLVDRLDAYAESNMTRSAQSPAKGSDGNDE